MVGVRQAWVASYSGIFDEEPTGMVVDGSGNVYVTGYTAIPDYSAFVTIKYNTQGQEEWGAGYNPPNSISSATAIAVDHSGNVYVTGTNGTFGLGYPDYITIKYNNSGQQQWIARYDGAPNSDDEPTAIAADDLGNVYVTGRSGSPAEYATIKYDSSGQQQWVARYSGPDNGDSVPVAIAVNSSGDAYVTGSSRATATGTDYATIKYDNGGQEQWVARYSGTGNNFDSPTGMAIDASGNVYVTGTSWVAAGISDYATIKYDNSGQQQWVSRYNGTGHGIDQAAGIGIDASGNVYVTGSSAGSDGKGDYATIKYNSVGQQQWASRYRALGSSGDFATAIAVSRSGNAYVTGYSLGDYGTVKYNSSGQQEWVVLYDGFQGFDDYARAIALDRRENVYVTGASHQSDVVFDWDFATVKYIPDRMPLPQPRP